MVEAENGELSRHLKRFTTDAIVSTVQRDVLRKAGYIAYTHRFWHLTDMGKAEAQRLGFL